jgi:hypothetical protein
MGIANPSWRASKFAKELENRPMTGQFQIQKSDGDESLCVPKPKVEINVEHRDL